MKYYLNCKYNGPKGLLLTIAIVREDNTAIYLGVHNADATQVAVDPWITEHVIPVMNKSPINLRWVAPWQLAQDIAAFFRHDPAPHIIANWPDDVAYFCNAIKEDAGHVAGFHNGFTVEMRQVEAYPTEVATAVKHNSVWDAIALKHKVEWPNGMKDISA